MKVYPSIVSSVKFNNNQAKNKELASKNKVAEQQVYQSVPFFGAGYYVGFKGKNDNACVDLAQTMERLYEAEALKGERIIPERVREATEFVLGAGNPNNLSLVDVHKQMYEDMLYSESLDEVKKKYPEFSSVVSMSDVEKRRNSFISDVKSGNNKLFSSDEDLSLQLLKLYWAEAYSLSDLEKYVDSRTNMQDVLSDLNIQRRHPHYALRLKLSDSEYNERFLETLRLRQAQRIEKTTGGVYIPRGTLSEETKKKISEGLISYYSKNPERIYLQSARQREFFRNNPEISKLFREVLFDAWRLGSSKPVKASMKKFYESKRVEEQRKQAELERLALIKGISMPKKQKPLEVPADEELASVSQLGAKQRVLMQEFWDKNPEAKRLFGRSLTCAWSRVKKMKESESGLLVLDKGLPAYPKKMADRMRAWTVSKGYDADSIMLNMSITIGDFNQSMANKTMGAKLVTEYFIENPVMSDVYADSLAYALSELREYLSYNRSTCGDLAIQKIENVAKGKKYLYVNELSCLYLDVIQILLKNDNIDGVVKLVSSLERAYDVVMNWRKQKGENLPD